MSNIDKAAETILPYTGDCDECMRLEGMCLDCVRESKDAALALDEAGLLVPDFPEPDECPIHILDPGWQLGSYDAYAAASTGCVWITNERGAEYPVPPSEAREIALRILAAAQRAEDMSQ